MTAKCYRTASTSIMKENRRIATLTAPLDRHATPQARAAPARISFPSHLRLMWRGGEVRAWLNRHQGITPPQTTANDSLERYQQRKAEQALACAPCTCPSGDGSLRHPYPAHPQTNEGRA